MRDSHPPDIALGPGSLDELLDTWKTAAQKAGGIIERAFVVGGHPVRLRFAGPELVTQSTRALAHLATDEDVAPALTIHVGDSQSTGSEAVPPSIRGDRFGEGGWILNGVRMRGRFEPPYGSLSLLDIERGLALFWTDGLAGLPYWETASPLRHIFHWWMGTRGLEFVHAAAVGNDNGGVLLVGKAGSGKSSSALACLDSDLFWTGDDYQLADIKDPPVVHGLYNSAKLERDNLKRFPNLAPHVANALFESSEKGIVFIQEIAPEKISNRVTIRAVLVPRIGDDENTWVAPTSAGTALTALAPSTIFQLHDRRSDALSTLASLLELVPSFRLNVGRDITAVPGAISRLLSQTLSTRP